ncbi:MAG: DUF2059 domain-containing protein [Rhodospirillales bacterium]|nr:DUF2059 domain-containing protein [Rhodospirillales bacterium]
MDNAALRSPRMQTELRLTRTHTPENDLTRAIMLAPGLLAVCLIVFFANAALADSDIADTMENRRALAERHVALTLPVMLKDIEEASAETFPAGVERDLYLQMIREVLNIESLEAIIVPAMTTHFTVEEIEALSEFYETPAGSAILTKYSAYIADMQPGLVDIVLQALSRTKEALGMKE